MNVKQRVSNFWKYFESMRTDLEHALKEHNTTEMQHFMSDINERSMDVCACKIEIEMSDTDFYEMTFDTADDKTAQYIAALLVKSAPDALREDWILNAFRQPLSEKALHSVLNIDDKTYSGADFKVYYTIDDESKSLFLRVYCEGIKRLEDERKQRIVAYMLELFIGELELEARIAHVEILDEEPKSDEENFCLLPNLYEDICDIIIDKEWMEYHDPLSIYQAYKLDKRPVSKTLRNDCKLIVTTNSQLQEDMMNKRFDTCKDFKNLGGEYGYLYYEVLYENEKEALVRHQLEKEINDLLYSMSIARTMGGAVGEYYSYIDVAIFDFEHFMVALEKMNEKMSFKIYYKSFL